MHFSNFANVYSAWESIRNVSTTYEDHYQHEGNCLFLGIDISDKTDEHNLHTNLSRGILSAGYEYFYLNLKLIIYHVHRRKLI